MYSKTKSFAVILIAVGIYLGLWSLACAGDLDKHCLYRGIGTGLGVAGYTFFSLSLLLSSRWRILEDWIGGLDRIYHFHRQLGILGFCSILIHPWFEAVKWLPHRLDKFFLFTFPIHGRLSMNFGSLAFWMMIIILGITLLKLLPYDKWKVLHKFMSLVFVLATLHILLSDRRFGSEFAQLLLYIPMVIGLFGIVYKQVYVSFFTNRDLFEVSGVRRVNDNVVEVELRPKDTPIEYIPGQYGFFSFEGPSLTRECHPFTMIESERDNASIILLVKARGDFTKDFYRYIKEGYLAEYEGPYGRFDYSNQGKSQIWIGGGIGIVPFLSWIRSMRNGLPEGHTIDFYYCAHRKVDAIFFHEFKDFEKLYPQFRFFLHCTEENNRLEIQKIQANSGGLEGKKILMCGPMKLTRSFSKAFQEIGVKWKDIIFEDFEFF